MTKDLISKKADVNLRAIIGKNVEIDAFAQVADDVNIEDNVKVGRGTIINSHSSINKDTIIEANCIIGHPTKLDLVKTDHSSTDPNLKDLIVSDRQAIIGENSIIRSGTTIYSHTNLGSGFNTGHNAVIREHTYIGSHCIVGSNSVLNGYSRIGEYTRINTLCALPQSMRIGNGVFIATLVAFSDNDRAFPGEGNKAAIVEDYVRIGIGVNILPRIRLGRGCLIGAGAVVTKDVPEKALAYGVPATIKGYLNDSELEKYISSIRRWV